MERIELYNGEITLLYDDDTHTYRIGEEIIPSVTGILDKAIDKPWLAGWAAKMCGVYLQDNAIEFVNTCITDDKQVDEIAIEEFIKDMKASRYRASSKAANIGTLVHKTIEHYIAANLSNGMIAMPERPVNENAMNSLKAYFDWEKENEVEYIESEFKIYNNMSEYAGTCDIDAVINGKRAIVDIKTSNQFDPKMGLQLAAYQAAREREHKGPYETRYIIRLDKESGKPYMKEYPDFKEDYDGFLGALNLYNSLNRSKK